MTYYLKVKPTSYTLDTAFSELMGYDKDIRDAVKGLNNKALLKGVEDLNPNVAKDLQPALRDLEAAYKKLHKVYSDMALKMFFKRD